MIETRKPGKIISELRKSNTAFRLALGLAFVFMGLQWWPVEYNYGMKLGMSAVFLLFGFWLAIFNPKTQQENRYNKVMRWVNSIITAVGLVLAIALYIVSWVNSMHA